MKTIYFDMDGTMADLYGVEHWLERLRAYDSTPYAEAKPMIDVKQFRELVNKLRASGFRIGVISWVSKASPPHYTAATRRAKLDWLRDVLGVEFDEIHITRYGAAKHIIPRPEHRRGILVDDNEEICEQWRMYGGISINANRTNWIEDLRLLCG